MNIAALIQAIFTAIGSFFGYQRDRQLKQAGGDKVKKEQAEEVIRRVKRANQIDNASDSIDVIRERLRNNADD